MTRQINLKWVEDQIQEAQQFVTSLVLINESMFEAEARRQMQDYPACQDSSTVVK